MVKGNLAGTEEQGGGVGGGLGLLTPPQTATGWAGSLDFPVTGLWVGAGRESQDECPLKVPRNAWGRPPSTPDCNSPGELGGETGACRLWVLSLCSHSFFNQSGPPSAYTVGLPVGLFEGTGLLLKTV